MSLCEVFYSAIKRRLSEFLYERLRSRDYYVFYASRDLEFDVIVNPCSCLPKTPCVHIVKCSVCDVDCWIDVAILSLIEILRQIIPNVQVRYVCTNCVKERRIKSLYIFESFKDIVTLHKIIFCTYAEIFNIPLFHMICQNEELLRVALERIRENISKHQK